MAKWEINVPELNHPGSSFSVPEEGGAMMIGLRAVGFQFHLKLIWHENWEEYSSSPHNCQCCRPCERPRCGVCAGCFTRPGKVFKSNHDFCHWKRCVFRAWKPNSEMERLRVPTNEVVLTRVWLQHVNSLCARISDKDSKVMVRDRLALYNDHVLNQTAEGERKFWLEDPRAFEYPVIKIQGGDKFAKTYKKLEIAQYRIAMASRQIKVEHGFNPEHSLDKIKHDLDMRFRASLETEREESEVRDPDFLEAQEQRPVSRKRLRQVSEDKRSIPEASGKDNPVSLPLSLQTLGLFILIKRVPIKHRNTGLRILLGTNNGCEGSHTKKA